MRLQTCLIVKVLGQNLEVLHPVLLVRALCVHWVPDLLYCTVCPTRYRTRLFFNNSNTNEDIATKFEHEYVRCVINEKECVCSVCL